MYFFFFNFKGVLKPIIKNKKVILVKIKLKYNGFSCPKKVEATNKPSSELVKKSKNNFLREIF